MRNHGPIGILLLGLLLSSACEEATKPDPSRTRASMEIPDFVKKETTPKVHAERKARRVQRLSERLAKLRGQEQAGVVVKNALEISHELIQTLVRIDPQHALAHIKKHMHYAVTYQRKDRNDDDPAKFTTWLYALRAELGDESALD